MKLVINTRKQVLRNCHYIRPLVPPVVYGKKWEDGDTDKMANDMNYWAFEPGAKWHGFEGYARPVLHRSDEAAVRYGRH